jgi:hypothetical protein
MGASLPVAMGREPARERPAAAGDGGLGEGYWGKEHVRLSSLVRGSAPGQTVQKIFPRKVV